MGIVKQISRNHPQLDFDANIPNKMVKPKEFNIEIGKRIRKAINYIVFIEDLANQRDVAELVGKDKDNLSKALKGDTTYTGIYIEAICGTYSTFNKEWFYTGNGDMLSKDFPITNTPTTDKDIKILDIRVSAGHGVGFDGDENKILGYVNIPNFSGCYGVTVYGDSMYDKYSSGDIVFVREIKDKREIEGGQSYVVITNEDRYLKMIYIEDRKLKLVSYNNAINPDGRRKYPDMLIEGEQIKFLYKVVGRLERTQM